MAGSNNAMRTIKESDQKDLLDGVDDAAADVDTEKLVRDNIAWMLALAQRLLNDRGLAEDATQEAFVAAFRALPSFEGRSSLNRRI